MREGCEEFEDCGAGVFSFEVGRDLQYKHVSKAPLLHKKLMLPSILLQIAGLGAFGVFSSMKIVFLKMFGFSAFVPF